MVCFVLCVVVGGGVGCGGGRGGGGGGRGVCTKSDICEGRSLLTQTM